MQSQGQKVRSIADGANHPGQAAAPIQLQRDDSLFRWFTGYLLLLSYWKLQDDYVGCCWPWLSPCMTYVSSLSPIVPIAGSVQDTGETVTT